MEKTAESAFVGANLRVARNFSGLTLSELAKLVSVSHSTIHHLETGVRRPGDGLDAALGEALGFEAPYFYAPLVEEFREEECHFRSRTMAASLRTRLLSLGTLFGAFIHYLSRRVKLPAVAMPSERAGDKETVERAAESCRRKLGIGLDRPALNVCRALEGWGAVVTRFEASTAEGDALRVDAFSRTGMRPVVVLNMDKGSSSRTRWDMAHELGHLVMHGGLRPGEPELEEQADQFATAFLLPRVGFLREFPPQNRLSWEIVFALKRRWRVSAASIVRRAYAFGRIGALEYRRAWKHYMYRAWHRGEPSEPEEELPEVVPRALALLHDRKGTSTIDIANAMGWRKETFERVVGVPARPTVAEKGGAKVVLLDPTRRYDLA